jgi:hypothetical protein
MRAVNNLLDEARGDNGVAVAVTVEVDDFQALGRFLAAQNSDDQTDLLVGLADGFAGFDGRLARDKQLDYIATELLSRPDGGEDVRALLADLLGFINAEVSA